MTRRDVRQDTYAPYGETNRRLRQLETGKPQQSASIQSGMTQVINAAGAPLAALGHAAGRAGLLLPSGSSWVTVQEWTGIQIAQQVTALQGDIVYLNNQLAIANGRIDTVDTGLGVERGRITNVDQALGVERGRIDNVDQRLVNVTGRMASAEGSLSNLSGRMGSAESSLSGLANTLTNLGQTVAQLASDLSTLRTRFNNHGAGAPNHPPGSAGG